MINRLKGVFVLVFLAGLAACQSSGSPVLPVGVEAYGAIESTEEPMPLDQYVLRGGDVVSIAVFQEPDLSRDRLVIDAAGDLNLPLVGRVRAGGKTASHFALDLEEAYGNRYLRKPRVSVYIDQPVVDVITVEGQVSQPGEFPFRPGLTLVKAIAQARSPSNVAKLDQVVIFRTINGQRMGGQFDLQAIRDGRADDPRLAAGDVVIVGFSSVKGAWRDFLQAAPLLGIFRPF